MQNSKPPPTPPAGDGESLLGRHDVNKGDVPGLLGFATPNLLCPGESPTPAIDVYGTSDVNGTPVALRYFVFCLTGFTPNGTVDAVITSPDGSDHPIQLELDERGAASAGADVIGAETAGSYAITATDPSDTSRTASASVWHGRVTVSPESASLGVPFEINLDGFPPGHEVSAYLYRREPCETDPAGCWSFRAYLPAIITDASGHGRLELATEADDPDGSYCVMVGTVLHLDPCRASFTATSP